MKQYQITFNVPDDFDPEEMELNVTYKDNVAILNEGFIDDIAIRYEDVRKAIDNNCSFTKASISDHDVVIFKFPKSVLELPDGSAFIQLIRSTIESEFKCPVVGFIDDLDILVENADQAIDMFNGMIAKVKVRAAVKDTSKIILGG